MKNILVCISGLTPQIISEALYCLSVQRKIEIHELYVLTTQRGQDVIKGIDKAVNTPKVPLFKEIAALCKIYKIKKPKFTITDKHILVTKEETIELADIRTDKDNILFPNIASNFIKSLTSDPENILYCVISGGRKTMSVHLANALSLFGRETDKLLHILTHEKNEFKGFYPKTNEEDRTLELSEIPYLRLRYLISSSLHKEEFASMNYSQIVEFTQNKLKTVADERKLIINTITKEIIFDKKKIKLEPTLFAIYYKFIEHKTEDGNPLSIMDINSLEFSISLKDIILKFIPNYHPNDSKKPWWTKEFDQSNFRSSRSKINKALTQLFDDKNILNEFQISSIKDYYNTAYTILASKDKIQIIYRA